jgi:hypothetical protein
VQSLRVEQSDASVVDSNELCIFLCHAELCKDLLGEVRPEDSSDEIQLHEPISIVRRGGAAKLILSNGECKSDAPIASLVRAVQARTWSEWSSPERSGT